MHNASFRLALLTCFAALFCTAAFAQTATFTTTTSPSGIYQARTVTGDLNSDGREDFVSTQQVNSPLPGFTVQLSNGDGTYAAPTSYQLPETQAFAYDIVLADVNSDGKLDIIVTAQNFGFYEYLNNGDGTFRLQANFVIATGWARVMAVGDFNHDGRPDLAFDCSPDATATQICIYFGNGDNGFDAGPITNVSPYYGFDILVGDFDGDGNADIALIGTTSRSTTNIVFLYGDNTGNFQVSNENTDLAQLAFQVADLNGDGKSDLIGSPMNTQNGSPTNFLIVYYGNSARTADHQTIPLGSCATGYKPAIADFNGDGIPDIVVTEFATCTAQPYNLVIKQGNGDGTFSSESVIYTSSTIFSEAYTLRANGDTKPDVAVIHFTAANPQTELVDLLNTTSGGDFPTCVPPQTATGFNIASPGSTAPSGNVNFCIGAAGQTDMRKVEVWVDGNKVAEQLKHQFSHYGFLNASVPIADGSHTVDIYAAGWDNLLQHTSFTVTVGGTSGGGGGTCPQPTSPGVNICSPTNGSTVTSPFTISASGRNTNGTSGMDVWLDGNKVGWYGGTTSVNIQVSAGAGSHQLDIYAVGVDGELKLSSVIFTVGSTSGGGGGTGTCTAPSSPGVNICAPANGSTVGSPVTITAAGTNNGTTSGMDVWIDGQKLGWFGGTNMVNTQATLGAGTHQLDIYAVGTNGDLQKSTVIFTVSGTSGGGGGGTSCGPPSTPSVVICSPTNGSTVSSPVQITAYGMNNGSTDGMDLWIDGQHTPGWFGGTTSVSTSVNLSAGTHQLDVYASGTNGDLQHASVVFTAH